MRIAMIGHKRIPSREGGVEVVVEELSTRMVALGHKVTCYNRSGHHVNGKEYDNEKIAEYRGVRLKNVWTVDIKGLAAVLSSCWGAFACAIGRYDVIHFHAEGPCAMLWLPKLFRKRCIATIHGLDHQRTKWGKLACRYIMLGEKCAVKYADEIIVLSKNVQKYFKQTYGRDTVFIPNGVTRPEIQEARFVTEKYNLKKDSYFLYLARIVPEKGLRYLIQAYKSVKTDKKLVIAGGPSDTEDFLNELKGMAKGDERIIFTGFVQGQMLEELYSNAYTYILPSDLEGMPLSLLEAMSYGNCCLVSDIPECTEVVEDKAVIFERGNVEQLRITLQRLCEMKDKVNKHKNAAMEFICNKYNWDEVVERTLELYGGKNL